MKTFVFASGSQGNCTAVELGNNKIVLIDVGISRAKIESCLKDIGHTPSDIEAIFITHDHSDHQKFLGDFQDFSDRIYSGRISAKTNRMEATTSLDDEEQKDWPFVLDVGNASIRAIPLSHYAAGDCFGYIIQERKEKLVYITDTGLIYEDVREMIKDATYYVVESNYDIDMLLKNKSKPNFLKNTILSLRGHLANSTMTLEEYQRAIRDFKLMIDNPSRYDFSKTGAADYLAEAIGPETQGVILAHLSSDNNTPELAVEAFNKACDKAGKDIAKVEVKTAGNGTKGITTFDRCQCELHKTK